MKKVKNIITTIAAITLFLCGSCTEYAGNTQMILCAISAIWLLYAQCSANKKSRKKENTAQETRAVSVKNM